MKPADYLAHSKALMIVESMHGWIDGWMDGRTNGETLRAGINSGMRPEVLLNRW